MPLSRSFKDVVRDRAQRDPSFRTALLSEAIEALGTGDAETAKSLIRDFINATLGFDELGKSIGMDPKNLMRMFGPRGNPQLANLSAVLRELARREGLAFRVEPIVAAE